MHEAPLALGRATSRGVNPDRAFRWLSLACGAAAVAVLGAMAVFLVGEAFPAIRNYGFWSFLHFRWAPSEATSSSAVNPYGIVQFIYGTLITSALAMVLAVPISVGVALFITQIAPPRLRKPLVAVTELLAAVPSVVYGFWALFALLPALRPVARLSESTLGRLPVVGGVFEGPFFGFSYFAASIVLTIMILPIITAIVREVFTTVPRDHREAALALGATRWEMIRVAVLPYSRNGILGASFLGLGRALGETIAVTMVIGNNVIGISKSILGQGATLASVVANEFTEANQPFHLESLFVVAFWLLLITLVVNIGARLLVNRSGRVIGGTL
ncbi:MAG: phosphate ABC transporter permease subunit PstC [Acidimicrobiales bacterium]